MLGHDPDDPDGEDGNQRVLAVSSSNLAAIAPSCVYRIDTARIMGDTEEEITTAAMVFVGESAVGAHDLLGGQPDDDERMAGGEAEHFLEVELADGPRPASEIEAGARRIGIARTTLFRARRALGVESSKAGFKGGWEWSLPEGSTAKVPPSAPRTRNLRTLRDQERDSGGTEGAEGSQDSAETDVAPSLWDGASAEAEITRLERKRAEAPPCSCLHPEPALDGHCGTCHGRIPDVPGAA
jgi:transposase-like protein